MTAVRQSFGFPLAHATHSDVGRVRTNNEDSQGSAWLSDGSLFAMVADGMGGHEAGEVASNLAVQVVLEAMGRDPDADPRERMYHALLEANGAILDEGSRGGTKGMGTTSVCALFRGSEVFIALIGDSRCYHVRRGHLVWRTLDHTRVQMLLDNGEITEEEARNHPEAGMLTRALGHERMADGRALEPDVMAEALTLEDSDAIVLCSDGLHDLVEDWEIGQVVAGRDPMEAAKALVQTACDRGGHDNVTVAVVTAGPRAAEFDPHYVPEYSRVGHPGAPEATYDEPNTSGGAHHAYLHDVPKSSAPATVAPRRTGLYVGVAIAAVVLLVVGLFVAAVAAGLIWRFV